MMRRNNETKVISNVRVGRPDAKMTTPSHVPGIFQGNHPHILQRGKGLAHEEPLRAEGDARRSTGVRPSAHDVIDPRMPRLSPA
ncbi:MAG: hypothetical protein JWO36_1259 [Myxococcales bacterium]|nr:hypothetical protein [Myxococcales bacterium]